MFAKFWVLIEWKTQKGVFKIKLLLLELLNSPAFIGLMGFNCNPPLAPIIKIPVANKKTTIPLKIDFVFNLEVGRSLILNNNQIWIIVNSVIGQ